MIEQNPHADSSSRTKDGLKKLIKTRDETGKKIWELKCKLNNIQANLFRLRIQKSQLESKYSRWQLLGALISVLQVWHKKLPGKIKEKKIYKSTGICLAKIKRKSSNKRGSLKRKWKSVDRKIEDKENMEIKNGRELEDAQKKLETEKDNVISYAAELNEQAANVPLKQIKDLGPRYYEKLGLPGIMSLGYLLSVLAGLIFDFIYYNHYKIYIFHYAQPEDFFLSGYKLLIIPLLMFIFLYVIYRVALHLLAQLVGGFKVPVYTEKLALFFPGLMNLMPVSALFFSIFAVLTLGASATVGWAKANYFDSQDKVSILIEDPLNHVENLDLVNSNSTYAFFKEYTDTDQQDNSILFYVEKYTSRIKEIFNQLAAPKQDNKPEQDKKSEPAGNNESNLMIVPLSRITCINEYSDDQSNEDFCKPKVTQVPTSVGTTQIIVEPAPVTVVSPPITVEPAPVTLEPGDIKVEMDDLIAEPKVNVKLSPEDNLWINQLINKMDDLTLIHPVTENKFYSHIQGEIQCETTPPLFSEFLLFKKGKSELDSQVKHKITSFRDKIKGFELAKVHGFASADGQSGHNQELASRRACVVAENLCPDKENNDYDGIDCAEFIEEEGKDCNGMKVQVLASHGEDHFINGVANSRSAMIAACVRAASGHMNKQAL